MVFCSIPSKLPSLAFDYRLKVDIILLRSDYSRPVYFACSVKFHTKQDHHEGNDVTVSQQYVIFKLNDKYFGVNIAHVMEIIWPQKVFKVPDTPPYVEGLINVRGKVFALLNLKKIPSSGYKGNG